MPDTKSLPLLSHRPCRNPIPVITANEASGAATYRSFFICIYQVAYGEKMCFTFPIHELYIYIYIKAREATCRELPTDGVPRTSCHRPCPTSTPSRCINRETRNPADTTSASNPISRNWSRSGTINMPPVSASGGTMSQVSEDSEGHSPVSGVRGSSFRVRSGQVRGMRS